MNNRDKKNIMIICLLVAVVFMSVGYALLSAQLDIKGSTSIVDPVWDVKISSISSTSTEGYGTSLNATVENRFSAKFNAELKMPGDKVTYVINVKNEGTIAAKLNSITITPENYSEGFIKYTIEGIAAGDTLDVGESKMFNLEVSYNTEKTGTPSNEELTKEITLMLDYIQK